MELFINGLEASGVVIVVRGVIGLISPRLLEIKPFSCNLCCSWWSSFFLFSIFGLAALYVERSPFLPPFKIDVFACTALTFAYLQTFHRQEGVKRVMLPPTEASPTDGGDKHTLKVTIRS